MQLATGTESERTLLMEPSGTRYFNHRSGFEMDSSGRTPRHGQDREGKGRQDGDEEAPVLVGDDLRDAALRSCCGPTDTGIRASPAADCPVAGSGTLFTSSSFDVTAALPSIGGDLGTQAAAKKT